MLTPATPLDLALYANQLRDTVLADLRRPAAAVESARRAAPASGGAATGRITAAEKISPR